MVFSSVRVIILLICVGFLTVQLNKVHGLTSVELAIRHSKNAPVTVSSHQRILTDSAMQGMKTEKKAASLKKRLDPYRSSKRRVRKESRNKPWAHLRVGVIDCYSMRKILCYRKKQIIALSHSKIFLLSDFQVGFFFP